MTYLETRGGTRTALVGHSFGGAVVITAAANDEHVVGVAALSSQTHRTGDADRRAPCPLLLLHGLADRVLRDYCSRDIYRRAGEPRELILYPGCGHGLDGSREEVDRDLQNWLRKVLGKEEPKVR